MGERPKSMRFPLGEYSRKEREFYDDSNTGYYKEKFKHAKKKEKKTQNYDDHLDISFYKNFLMKDNMDLYGKTLEDMKTFLLKKSEEIVDHPQLKLLKKQTKKILTDPGCILSPVPEFEGDQIRNKTKGGKVNLHSIWTDFEVTNIEQILEETFIYVHTMEEPASLYHEKIKAVNTILKFQEEFDNAGDEKYGKVNNFEEMLKFTSTRFQGKKEKYIGYSSNVIYNSFKNLIEIIKPDFKKIINDVLEESIGEIVSTKAVIHDIGRNYKISDEDRKSVMKRIFKRMRKVGKISPEDTEFEKFYGKYKEEKDKKRFILENMSSYYHSKPRQKVWETILDVLEDNKSLRTVEEFLDLYLKKEEGEMEADICIKAQYGSKESFMLLISVVKFMQGLLKSFSIISVVTVLVNVSQFQETRKNETLHSSITDQLCFNLTKDSIYNVVSGSISMIKNPFNEKKYYVSTHVL